MDANSLLLTVTKAEYDRDYTLRITFSNGEVRLVDFTPLMQKGICKKLQDMNTFTNAVFNPIRLLNFIKMYHQARMGKVTSAS